MRLTSRASVRLIIALVAAGIGGIFLYSSNRTLSLNEDRVSSMLVRNGSTFESAAIEDRMEIAKIVSEINDFKLVRSKKWEPGTGWSIILDIYDTQDINKYRRYDFRVDGIVYNNYLYSSNEYTRQLHVYLENMFIKE